MSQPRHSAFESTVPSHVRAASGVSPHSASNRKFWSGLSGAVMEQIADNWERTRAAYAETRQQHYFSAEFLQGRALLNNLTNLGLVDDAKTAAKATDHELSDVLEAEHDAALGNGGLGRLAACFLDSAVTQDYPVTGYGLLYRYGLFRQSFENGFQKEQPDAWMENGYDFVIRRASEQRRVHFDDMDVRAIPYDMPITGYGTDNVGTLRLWKSEPIDDFDYDAFNSQRFTEAIVERERVMDICRVLYPNDTTYEGKVLRVRQQYFFVSASLQTMVDNYIDQHGEDLTGFAKYNSIQLNDTHPVLAIPELLRILLDEHGLSWDAAWKIVTETFAYTNHTLLPEALESWPVPLVERLLPRHMQIVYAVNSRLLAEALGSLLLVLPLAVAVFRLTSPVANLAVCLYVAQLNGIELGLPALIAGGLTAFAVSIASVGLPGQVSFFAAVGPICLAMGCPLGVLPLLLAVEVVPDILRTVGNVTADMGVTRILDVREAGAPS